ncbi:DUF4232 domain-containing protein [Streptomyces sp. NPDC006368]|uniref:DUF4232 domain-containing protein n=1 Tax=Streptomyces sp. NPDC006368 TaxID=3156760 RepID=UPI0033BA81CF
MCTRRLAAVAALAPLAFLAVACDDETGAAPLPRRVTASPTLSPPSPLPPVRTGPDDATAGAGAGTGSGRAACPASGVRVSTGPVDAAMGLRAMGVTVLNCGTKPFEVSGYPAIDVLDAEREKLDVTVRLGSNADSTAQRSTFVLQPGGQAHASVIWRNTVTRSDVVATSGVHVRVTPAPGVVPQTITPEDGPLDLGTTNAIEVTPWKPSDRQDR